MKKTTRDGICREILSLENELEALLEIGIRSEILVEKRKRLTRLKSALKNDSEISDEQVDKLFSHINGD